MKRWNIALVGLVGLIVLAAILVPRPRENGDHRRRKSPPLPEAGTAAAPEVAMTPQRLPVAPATRVAEPPQVARAMDLSNVRSLVTTLKEAAATENAGLKSSMLSALGRYGETARPVIEEEIGRAHDPKVKAALDEALASAR